MNQASTEVLESWKEIGCCGLNVAVQIDYTRLAELAQENYYKVFAVPSWRHTGIYPEREWSFVSMLLVASTCNACFNIPGVPGAKFTVPHFNSAATRPLRGSFALYRRFVEHWDGKIILARDLWPHIETEKALGEFFGGDPKMPALHLKQRALLDYVVGLEQHFQGNPLNIIEEASTWDEDCKVNLVRAFSPIGKGLAQLLVEKFPVAYGEDVQIFPETELRFPFNKRAQLVPLMLHGRASDSQGKLPRVGDVDSLGAIVDYEIPRILRALGVLQFSATLSELVDNWKEIAKDSSFEIQIRGATAVAVHALMSHINQLRLARWMTKLNMCHIDYWLWSAGLQAKGLYPHIVITNSN